jgi:hypothetical protein
VSCVAVASDGQWAVTGGHDKVRLSGVGARGKRARARGQPVRRVLAARAWAAQHLPFPSPPPPRTSRLHHLAPPATTTNHHQQLPPHTLTRHLHLQALRVWDLSNGAELAALPAHGGTFGVTAVALSSDGGAIVSGG